VVVGGGGGNRGELLRKVKILQFGLFYCILLEKKVDYDIDSVR